MPGLPIGKRLLDKLKKKRDLDSSSSRGAPPTSVAKTSNAETAISKTPISQPPIPVVADPVLLTAPLANSESSRADLSTIRVSETTESHMITPDTPSLHTAVLPSSPANAVTTSSRSPLPLVATPPAVTIEADRAALPVISDPPSPTATPSVSSSTPGPRDLWTKALRKLSPEDQQAVHGLQPRSNTQRPMPESIEELLILTRKVQADCKAKSYKFRFKGKDIILRDVAGKVIFWLNKFKEVGDVAVNFDPVHASLPWAGVRFFLQAATSEQEQMGDLVVATEKLSCLISRGAIYERLYQPGTVPEDELRNLHDAMVALYMTLLQILALSHRLFIKNTAKRAVHATLHPGDVLALLEKIEERELQVEYEAQNCERARSQKADASSKRLLEILREPVLRTDDRVLRLLEKTSERERLAILDWTSKVLYGSNHRTVKDERTPNTCEWLLSHSRYLEWKDSSASIILWLCGTAGTGKTFLTSKVIDENQFDLRSKPNQEGFAFFYCNRNESERREPLSVLRAFVRQLSTTVSDQDSIQKRLKAYYIECRLKASEPNLKDCKNLLLGFINVYPRTTLILDALDECERHERLELINILESLLAEASNPLRIFVSSRPDGDITDRLKSRANIQINSNDNHDDISRFVRSEIVKHRRWEKMTPTLQSQIVETLQYQSQGMFQWAYLQIKQLLDLQRPGEILDRLGKLPEDLKIAYDEIYNKMTEVEKRIANRAFQWVICAVKPLATIELLPAICQDENSNTLKPLDGLDEDLVLEYCHNLLVIDPIRQVWVPSHLSVIEYFENHLWTQGQANCLVASVCLVLLQNTVFYNREKTWGFPNSQRVIYENSSSPDSGDDAVPEENEIEDPLKDQNFEKLSLYARSYWMIHATKVSEVENYNFLSTLLEEFLGLPMVSSCAYRCWHRMVMTTDRYRRFETYDIDPRDICPVSIASFPYCAFGLNVVLPDWHNYAWVKEDVRTDLGKTCLELAAISGLSSVCRDLVHHGAEVNTMTKSITGSALAAAAYRGEKDLVEFLVKESGADVNMQLKHGEYGSALAAAAYRGRKEVVEFLVKDGGADVNMQLQRGEYGSALAAAAYGGEKEVVEFLVRDGGADVNMQLQRGEYGSALAAAAYGGEKEVVEFLVREGGADVNMQLQCGEYGSALAAAAYGGEKEVVEFLVKDRGADVNIQLQLGEYGSVLAAAAYGGEKKVVEFLVKDGGADVNMQLQHGEYGSALAAAASRGRNEVVEFLVKDGGADVNMQLQSGEYGSALAAAAYGGEKEVVEFLVRDGGADVNMQLQRGEYGSAIAAAAYGGEKEVVEFLVKDGGADVNMQLQHGKYGSVLAAAAYRGRNEVVEFLVKDGGADVNMQLQYGKYRSALAAAAYEGEKKVFEFLVKDGGADLNMKLQCGNYRTAVSAAYMRYGAIEGWHSC